MSLSLEFSTDKLWHLPQHLLYLCQSRIHAVRLIHPDILLPHLLPSSRVGAQSAHAHPHDIFMQISDAQLAAKQIAEEEVRVGGYLIALVIQPLTLNGTALDVASGVQRQPAMTNLPQAVAAPYPVAHHLISILRIHKQAITIQEVSVRVLKPLNDMRDRLVREQEVIRMYQTNHITRSSTNTLVDSFIHTMVRLRDDFRDFVLILIDNIQRIVLRSTIHHDILNIRIVLRQNTFYTTTNRLFTVVT